MCEQFVSLFSSNSTRNSQARVIVTSGLLIQEQNIVLILIISYGGFRYIYIDYTYNYVLTDNPITATRYLRFKVHMKKMKHKRCLLSLKNIGHLRLLLLVTLHFTQAWSGLNIHCKVSNCFFPEVCNCFGGFIRPTSLDHIKSFWYFHFLWTYLGHEDIILSY